MFNRPFKKQSGYNSNVLSTLIAFGAILVTLYGYMLKEDSRNEEDKLFIEKNINRAEPLIEAVEDFYNRMGHFPLAMSNLGIDLAYSPKVFDAIELYDDEGEIVLRFSQGRLKDRELFLYPVLEADGSIYRWLCHSDQGRKIKQRQLPFTCRESHPLNRLYNRTH